MSKTTVEIIGKESVSEAAKKASSASKLLSDMTGGLIKNFTDLTAAGLVVGKTIQEVAGFALDSYKAFAEQERAIVGWTAAMEHAPSITRGAAAGLRDFAEAMATLTGEDDEAVLQMESFLAMAGRTPGEIEKIITAAADMAVVTGDDLRGAVEKLNATYSGTAGRLEKLVPALDGLTESELKAGGAVEVIAKQFDGLSEAMGDTSDVKLKNMTNALDDLKAAVGSNAASLFSPLVEWIGKIADGWAKNLETMKKYREAEDTYSEYRTKQQQLEILLGEQLIQQKKVAAAYASVKLLENDLALNRGTMSPLDYSQSLLSIQTKSAPALERITGERELERLREEISKLREMLAAPPASPTGSSGSGATSGVYRWSQDRRREDVIEEAYWRENGAAYDEAIRATENAMLGAKWSGAGLDREDNIRKRQEDEMFSSETIVRGKTFFGLIETINGEMQKSGTVWDNIVESMGFANLSAEQMKMKLSDIGMSVMQGVFDNITAISDAMRAGADSNAVFADSLSLLIDGLIKALPLLAIQAGFQLIGQGHWKEGLVLAAAGGIAGIVDAIVEFPWEKQLKEDRAAGAGIYAGSGSSGSYGSNASYEKPRDIKVDVVINTPALVGEGGFRDFAIMIDRELRSAGILGTT